MPCPDGGLPDPLAPRCCASKNAGPTSPPTAARDRGAKRRIYQGAGVAEYWIVDLDARLVERWRPGDARPDVVSEELVWEPLPVIAARLDLPTLFVRVLGEA